MELINTPAPDAFAELGPELPTFVPVPMALVLAPAEEYFYAQIDSHGIATSVSHLSGPVDAPHMIRVPDFGSVQCGQVYDAATGVFSEPAAVLPIESTNISVGAFFDRFGAAKYSILSSANPMAQALVKDASVRTKDGVNLRSPALREGLKMLQQAGFAIDASAIVEAPIQASERP